MNNTIDCNASILDALRFLDELSEGVQSLTLFVIDETHTLCGTLTDGDIRRYLLSGGSVGNNVSEAMQKKYISVRENDNNTVLMLRKCKIAGVTLVPCLNEYGQIIDVYDLKNYQSYLPIDAILMAGGKGERLRPFTEKKPKPLLEVGNKAIIDYNIDRLISYGVKHISVTVNYLHEQIEKHFSKEREGIQVACIREPQYLGTIGSVNFVDTFFNDTVLVMNSDLFTNINYEDFYFHFKECGADMSVAAVPYTVSVPYGIFKLNGRYIEGIQEKPTYNYYANAGIYLIKRELLNRIPKDTFFNATDFMETLIHENLKVIRFPITGYWIDIGKPEEYIRAQELVKYL